VYFVKLLFSAVSTNSVPNYVKRTSECSFSGNINSKTGKVCPNTLEEHKSAINYFSCKNYRFNNNTPKIGIMLLNFQWSNRL